MYLSKFRLFNYKSFQDSGVLEFKPGINIIVGANNSGKTALLEGLSLNFQSNFHKSFMKIPSSSAVVNSSGYELFLNIEKETILKFIDSIYKSGETTLIPLPDRYTQNGKHLPSITIPQVLNTEDIKNIENTEIQMRYISPNIIPFDTIPNLFSSAYNTPIEKILMEELYTSNTIDPQYHGITNITGEGRGKSGSFTETIQYQIFQQYRLNIYKFNAERRCSSSSPLGMSRFLNSDASNLAEVLLNLQLNDPSLFEDFTEYVSRVIPSIKRISVPYYDNTVKIKVWTVDRARQREDLAYPLSDCGSGVSQVLAILYVVVTSKASRIIIIDEPQSFLHPGAAKKVIEILKNFPEHQYFITTHSAEIIAAANPSTIVKLRYKDGETQASTMNARDIREQRSLLAELGVSLSDVFGADSILWVEGPTERECFPLILEKLAPKLLTGTKIVSIKNTGDLLRKKDHFANVMLDLYERISGGNNLYPPAIGFVFDKECLSDSDIEDLKRRRPHPLKFIPRRMYENYLMHPEAIAFVLNQNIEEQKQFITSQEVQKWLESKKSNKEYFSTAPTEKDLSDPQWVDKHINAAKLLEELFANFPEAKVEFSKTTHSVTLTKWLLKNDSGCFAELVDFLQRILDEGKATVS